jgi:hypothetical protein
MTENQELNDAKIKEQNLENDNARSDVRYGDGVRTGVRYGDTPSEIQKRERADIEGEEQKMKAQGKHLNPDGSLDTDQVVKEKAENPTTHNADGSVKANEARKDPSVYNTDGTAKETPLMPGMFNTDGTVKLVPDDDNEKMKK